MVKKKEVIFNEKNMAQSHPSNEEKIGIAGGIASFVKVAVEQIEGSGEYAPDPQNPPSETTLDKVKDQVIGAGEFDVSESS